MSRACRAARSGALRKSHINIARDGLEVASAQIPKRRCHAQHDRESGWHHEVPRRRCGQNQPIRSFGILPRELLRQATAPGHPHDVTSLDFEFVQKGTRKRCEFRHSFWQQRRSCCTDARQIEGDHRYGQRTKQRLQKVDRSADAIEDE